METLDSYWDNICKIYFLTKHYLLLAEELSDEFDTFLQPVKEHRDAFDHITRVYGCKFMPNKLNDVNAYRIGNMKKAIGHVYRAFFDTADWLSYICRKKIRELLQNKSYSEISEKYENYDDLKLMLINVPLEISNIRKQKDISDDESVLIEEVEKYKAILDKLYNSYKDLSLIFDSIKS